MEPSLTSLHDLWTLVCKGLQLLVVQCTILLLELGMMFGCIASTLLWKGKSHKPRPLRCERKSRLMRKRQNISCLLVYLVLSSGVEGAAQQCAADDWAPWDALWGESLYEQSLNTLRFVSEHLDQWILPEGAPMTSDETTLMQAAAIFVDPASPREGTLAPVSEVDFFDSNRGGGFIMIWVHTFLWRHQMQLNNFRVSLRRFRERPMLGGSPLRDLFPMGSMWQEIVPAPPPSSLRHFVVWEDTHTYRFSFFVSFRRLWQSWHGSFLEEAEIGQLARISVEELFDRGTHGCICSQEPCKIVAPVQAEFGDTLLLEQGTHLFAVCLPEPSSSEGSLNSADSEGTTVQPLSSSHDEESGDNDTMNEEEEIEQEAMCLHQTQALSFRSWNNMLADGLSTPVADEQVADRSLREGLDDVGSFFQHSIDLPFWLRYASVTTETPPGVWGREELMISTTSILHFDVIAQEANMILRSRGLPPKFVVHQPGLDLPRSFTWSWTGSLNEVDLKLAIRLSFQTIGPDHRILIGYVDPQPTPNQQGGADDIHLLLSDHWLVHSRVPSLVVIEFVDLSQDPFMRAIECNLVTSKQQVIELLGVQTFCATSHECSLFLDGVQEIHHELFRIRGWQRLDLQLRSSSCNARTGLSIDLYMADPPNAGFEGGMEGDGVSLFHDFQRRSGHEQVEREYRQRNRVEQHLVDMRWQTSRANSMRTFETFWMLKVFPIPFCSILSSSPPMSLWGRFDGTAP